MLNFKICSTFSFMNILRRLVEVVENVNFSLPFVQNFKKEISSKTLTEGDAYQWEIVVNISFIMMSEMAFEIVCFDILSFSNVLETLNVIKVE